MPPKPGIETAQQARAFEDYWALGHSRSLDKLAATYRRQSDGGEDVPTVRKRTLDEWSIRWHWQERAAQRERDEAAEAERKNRERVQKFRERVMRAIDIDASAYLQKVSSAIGPNGELGAPQIILSASDLTKVVATFLQLAGEPQKHEVNSTLANAPGEAFATTVNHEMPANAQLVVLLTNAADLAARVAGLSSVPDEPGEDGLGCLGVAEPED